MPGRFSVHGNYIAISRPTLVTFLQKVILKDDSKEDHPRNHPVQMTPSNVHPERKASRTVQLAGKQSPSPDQHSFHKKKSKT